MNPDKIFRVHAKDVEHQAQAQVFEDLLNAPRFRAALLAEFEARSKEMANRVISAACGIVEGGGKK
jgi:hypothetical protein